MSDLISRQGVLRLLNAVPSEEFATKTMLISGVKAMPSAQQDVPDTNVGDIISRQAAIEVVKELCLHYTPTKSVNHPHMDFVIEELMNMPSAQQWIPVEERLPEDYTDVLAWFEYYRYGNYNCMYQMHGIGSYDSEYNSWLINGETGWHKLRVIAWMPLPEPYKEEQR